MQFLSDLDTPAVLLTGLSVLVVCLFLGLLWRSYGGRWPKGNARVLGVLLAVAFFCGNRAWVAYCPDADQPHIERTGAITPYKPYTYKVSGGRHSTTRRGLLVCIGACGPDVPLMEFDAEIMSSLAHRDLSREFKVIYLGRKEEADLGNGYAVTAHPAVEVDDGARGEQIYYKDTMRHWPRVIVLGAGGLLCVIALVLCLARGESESAEEDETSSQNEEYHSIGNDLTGLGLEGGGKNKE